MMRGLIAVAFGFFLLGMHSSSPSSSSDCHYLTKVQKYNLPFVAGCGLGNYINKGF